MAFTLIDEWIQTFPLTSNGFDEPTFELANCHEVYHSLPTHLDERQTDKGQHDTSEMGHFFHSDTNH